MNKTKVKVGEPYATRYLRYKYGSGTAITTDDPAQWRCAIPLSLEQHRISFTSAQGFPCAVALYHPDLAPNPEWELHVVKHTDLVIPWDIWLADMEPKVSAQLKRQAEARERLEREQKERAEREADERELRGILNAFGINDSDGWRGVNTKSRWSEDKGENVLTTYVRHLSLDDVLRLTGGRRKPGDRPRKAKA